MQKAVNTKVALSLKSKDVHMTPPVGTGSAGVTPPSTDPQILAQQKQILELQMLVQQLLLQQQQQNSEILKAKIPLFQLQLSEINRQEREVNQQIESGELHIKALQPNYENFQARVVNQLPLFRKNLEEWKKQVGKPERPPEPGYMTREQSIISTQKCIIACENKDWMNAGIVGIEAARKVIEYEDLQKKLINWKAEKAALINSRKTLEQQMSALN